MSAFFLSENSVWPMPSALRVGFSEKDVLFRKPHVGSASVFKDFTSDKGPGGPIEGSQVSR